MLVVLTSPAATVTTIVSWNESFGIVVDRNREGEKGAGAVQSEGGSLAFLLACFSRCARVDAFYGRKRTWDAF